MRSNDVQIKADVCHEKSGGCLFPGSDGGRRRQAPFHGQTKRQRIAQRGKPGRGSAVALMSVCVFIHNYSRCKVSAQMDHVRHHTQTPIQPRGIKAQKHRASERKKLE